MTDLAALSDAATAAPWRDATNVWGAPMIWGAEPLYAKDANNAVAVMEPKGSDLAYEQRKANAALIVALRNGIADGSLVSPKGHKISTLGPLRRKPIPF